MVVKARRISGEAQAEHYSNSLWSSALARDVFVTALSNPNCCREVPEQPVQIEAMRLAARRLVAGWQAKVRTRHFTWNSRPRPK
jgi:hypothetical protein